MSSLRATSYLLLFSVQLHVCWLDHGKLTNVHCQTKECHFNELRQIKGSVLPKIGISCLENKHGFEHIKQIVFLSGEKCLFLLKVNTCLSIWSYIFTLPSISLSVFHSICLGVASRLLPEPWLAHLGLVSAPNQLLFQPPSTRLFCQLQQ